LELAKIDDVQSHVDKNLADATVKLTKALRDAEQGIISIGTLFAIKMHGRLTVVSLTHEQAEFVRAHPVVYRDPQALLEILSRDPIQYPTLDALSRMLPRQGDVMPVRQVLPPPKKERLNPKPRS
jgi:hypothetical protein